MNSYLLTLSFTLSRIFSCKTQKFVRLSKFQKSPKNLDISTKNSRCKNVSEKLIITRNRVVAKQRRCEENTIVGNYFFHFYDMPHFVRRDIFAFAKVILRLRHSDILFAINTRRANITRLKAVYHCEAIELAVRRIELKKALAKLHLKN